MNIKIVCVGKLKENYWTQAVEEYLKRIGRFAKIEVGEAQGVNVKADIRSGDLIAVGFC